MATGLNQVVGAIDPLDDLEKAHQADTLAWIASGSPIYRTAKPATPAKHLVAYCVLVDSYRQSVLLVDHRDAGRWLATGGHVDPGENPADAAKRELHEELAVSTAFVDGLHEIPLFVTCSVTGGVSAGHTDVSLWYAFAGSEDDRLHPDPGEFADVRWWPMDQVRHGDGTRFDPNLPRFIDKLRQHWDRGMMNGWQNSSRRS